MKDATPEALIRDVIAECADCDICRYLMDGTPCQVFPELYRLYDREKEGRRRIASEALKRLVERCNLCGLCPCPSVRLGIMKAKEAFIRRDGLKPAVRLLEDVERVGKWCGAFPRLVSKVLKNGRCSRLLKRLAQIHPERKLPEIPDESFADWAERNGLRKPNDVPGRKVVFFAGCTGQFLFPEVPKAVVAVFRRNGISVTVPELKCCGMPPLLEGDRQTTLALVEENLEILWIFLQKGCDIICSCPTCGFFFKQILLDGVPASVKLGGTGSVQGARNGPSVPEAFRPADQRMVREAVERNLLVHTGYFAGIDMKKRLAVSARTFDLGEYLAHLLRRGELNTAFGSIPKRIVYYPPCHQREQKIGQPYAAILRCIPGVQLESVKGSFTCCGMAGIMGFKKEFHETSAAMARPLLEKIEELRPEQLITDCLSCRIQFEQFTSYSVRHPAEIVKSAYDAGDARVFSTALE